MKVLAADPGGDFRVEEIENDLHVLQNMVGGYIEVVADSDRGFAVICDEEGRIYDKKYNMTISGVDYVGTIVIAGVRDGEFTDCPEDVIVEFLEWNNG